MILAGIGLAIGIALVDLFPAMRRHIGMSNGIAGVLMIIAAGALYVVG